MKGSDEVNSVQFSINFWVILFYIYNFSYRKGLNIRFKVQVFSPPRNERSCIWVDSSQNNI